MENEIYKRDIYLATNNKSKAKELSALIPFPWNIKLLSDLSSPCTWDECGKTFVANATIKAKAVRKFLGNNFCVLADDSGLSVPALGGEPGLWSSRYAGEGASSKDNLEKLSTKLFSSDLEETSAFFTCALVFIDERGKIFEFEDRCYGKVVAKPLYGKNGFGYDPLFIPEGYDSTFACLPKSVKERISARAKATKKWLSHLQNTSL
jgi:XTP/dITP diphosphohydrolase